MLIDYGNNSLQVFVLQIAAISPTQGRIFKAIIQLLFTLYTTNPHGQARVGLFQPFTHPLPPFLQALIIYPIG